MAASAASLRASATTSLQPCSQALQRPALQLLDRAVGSAEYLRHFVNASPLPEPQLDDSPLIVGEPIDELKQRNLPLEIRIGGIGVRQWRPSRAG